MPDPSVALETNYSYVLLKKFCALSLIEWGLYGSGRVCPGLAPEKGAESTPDG